MTTNADPQTPRPWWTFGLLWLVIAGPAAVVVASIVTVWLTLAYPETVLAVDQRVQQRALLPAQQGRNHAITPGSRAGKP